MDHKEIWQYLKDFHAQEGLKKWLQICSSIRDCTNLEGERELQQSSISQVSKFDSLRVGLGFQDC